MSYIIIICFNKNILPQNHRDRFEDMELYNAIEIIKTR